MDNSKKESIHSARANYTKCNIGTPTGTQPEDKETDSDGADLSPQLKHKNTADMANAGDHMSRNDQNYISKICSRKRYIASERIFTGFIMHRILSLKPEPSWIHMQIQPLPALPVWYWNTLKKYVTSTLSLKVTNHSH